MAGGMHGRGVSMAGGMHGGGDMCGRGQPCQILRDTVIRSMSGR